MEGTRVRIIFFVIAIVMFHYMQSFSIENICILKGKYPIRRKTELVIFSKI